ncbi:MAG: imidazolonepropionase, partial [Chitinophagaceae bacterium]
MATLFTNIKTLVNVRATNHLLRGSELKDLPCIDDAYLMVEGAQIAEFGKMNELKWKPDAFAFHTDAAGRLLMPA